MKVLGMASFVVKEEEKEKVIDYLEDHIKFTKEQPGFIDGYVMQSLDSPNTYVVVSLWDSAENYSETYRRLVNSGKTQAEYLKMFNGLKESPCFSTYKLLS